MFNIDFACDVADYALRCVSTCLHTADFSFIFNTIIETPLWRTGLNSDCSNSLTCNQLKFEIGFEICRNLQSHVIYIVHLVLVLTLFSRPFVLFQPKLNFSTLAKVETCEYLN